MKTSNSESKPLNPAANKAKDEWPDYLNPTISKVINEKLNFTKMTPVQSVVLPIFIREHKDVVVEAVTGSGKTLAFVIPALEMLIKREERGGEKWKKTEIGALIITPTRELAQQIYDVINVFLGEFSGRFKSALFVGGVGSIVEDMKFLEANGANILVATVGRLEDLLTRSNSAALLKKCLKSLEVLILDEADRLLDMGFKESLESIFKFLPKQRRTGLFSATQTDEIDKLIRAGLRNPCNIQVKQKANPQKTPLGLHNYFIVVKPEQKFFVLFDVLKSKKKLKCLVFMNTCACVQYFSKMLKSLLNGVKVFELHRKIKDKRTKIFNEFKKLDSGVLVCTDILARGIDMDDVDWVIQYDAPKMVNSFVHRCGRTARSNREGNALTLLLPNEEAFVNFLRINQNVPLERYDEITQDVDQSLLLAFLKRVQDIASKEREVYEKGKEAFVSHIKAYSNHECSRIFQIKELDLLELGKGFGLLHMPRMPELKKYTNLEPFSNVDISKIPYKDKNKEKLRQQNPEQLKKAKPKFEKKSSWSNNKEKKLKKLIKQKKKVLNEKKRKHEFTEDDIKEIENDFRELKKIKKK